MKRVYLDNSATTPIDPRVIKEIFLHFKKTFGNPDSIYHEGVGSKKVLEDSRKNFASLLGAHTDEIIFTSGGTESNNIAILGVVKAFLEKNTTEECHVIISSVEHASVREVVYELRSSGIKVDEVPVLPNGLVDLQILKKLLKKETALVSVQYANNEMGAIQPIREIAKILKNYRDEKKEKNGENFPIFHTDASQAFCYLDCNVERLGVDLMTLDGQKIYGPKGVGALYVKRGAMISPIIFGGGQERGLRPGTPNVPLIAGLVKAGQICFDEREKETKRLSKLRDWLISEILKIAPKGAIINGDSKERLPNNVNFSVPSIDAEFLVLKLDVAGIAISTKSACLKQEESSYVVSALGGDDWRAKNTIRISLGRFTGYEDLKKLLINLKKYL